MRQVFCDSGIKMEVQRSEVTCPMSHSREVVELGYKLKQSDSRAHILKAWAALLP